MARSVGDLVNEAVSQLHGWGSTQDRVTGLLNAVGPTDLQIVVTDTFGQAVGITPGIVEIGSEQMYVKSVDPNTGVCVLTNFGRGVNGTTAVAHPAGVPVVSRPKFPRANVIQQMNDIMGGVFPDLFAVQPAFFTAQSFLNTYQLGDDAAWLVDCAAQDLQGQWRPVRRWRKDAYDNSLRIGDPLYSGQQIRVLYAAEPGYLVAETDDFESATGLPLSCADIFSLGAVARLTPGLDISRAQQTSVEQSSRSASVPPGAGVSASKYLMALYEDRLQNEAASLRKRYPARMSKGF